MTTDTAPDTASRGRTAAAQRPAVRPRRKKGEGQWALGYREPLNPNEQSNKDDHPLNVRARIENIYAKQGFASIDPNDLRGRFRWYGLYTQRRPGIDGGKTATLEPWELDDEYFMLRIRIDGDVTKRENVIVLRQLQSSVDDQRAAPILLNVELFNQWTHSYTADPNDSRSLQRLAVPLML